MLFMQVLVRKVERNKPGNWEAPWQLLQAVWQPIPVDTVQNLVQCTLNAKTMCSCDCCKGPLYKILTKHF